MQVRRGFRTQGSGIQDLFDEVLPLEAIEFKQ